MSVRVGLIAKMRTYIKAIPVLYRPAENKNQLKGPDANSVELIFPESLRALFKN